MGIDLPVQRVDEKIDLLRRMANGVEQVVLRIKIGEDELPGYVDGPNGNVEQFAKRQVNDAVAEGIAFFAVERFVHQVFIGIVVREFYSFLLEIVVEDTGYNIGLLDGCEVVVELEPGIAAQFFDLLQYKRIIHIGIMVPCNQQGALHEVVFPRGPVAEIFGEIAEVQPVNEQLDAFLHFLAAGVFPQVFEVGDDVFAEGYDLIADRAVYVLIRIIDQVEQGDYLVVFFQVVPVLNPKSQKACE